jgi:phosphopantothenoylcysteine decarboxylase/phosphopantothenate--cysteine ligase
MHEGMWTDAATQHNVRTLAARGVRIVGPVEGALAHGDAGMGRMAEPPEIAAAVVTAATNLGSTALRLTGRRILITAGPTHEPIDPVRYVGNRSSGKMGMALAAEALARGASVTLVLGPGTVAPPAGVDVVRIETAEQMRDAVMSRAADADAIVMAAAVADFRPRDRLDTKIKKSAAEPDPIVLVRNPDILAELAARPHGGQVVVGFAAETGDANGDVLTHGRAKLASKGADLLVVNEVGHDRGFEGPDNAAVILGSDGTEVDVPRGRKEALADRVWDLVAVRLAPLQDR